MADFLGTLAQLKAEYRQLVDYYEEIASYSQKEADLIKTNQMVTLLDILQVKEEIMLKAEKSQENIGQYQVTLCKFHELESFSIPKLLEKVPHAEHQLNNLQKIIQELINLLSNLAEQENDLELLLREYSLTSLAKQPKKQVHAAAKKAYSKVPKP